MTSLPLVDEYYCLERRPAYPVRAALGISLVFLQPFFRKLRGRRCGIDADDVSAFRRVVADYDIHLQLHGPVAAERRRRRLYQEKIRLKRYMKIRRRFCRILLYLNGYRF